MPEELSSTSPIGLLFHVTEGAILWIALNIG